MAEDKETKEENTSETDGLENTTTTAPKGVEVVVEPEETVTVSRKEFDELKSLVQATADKGRLYNYQRNREEKEPMKIMVSRHGGGIVIGWRTVKDKKILNPSTGLQTGEEYVAELVILKPDGKEEKLEVTGTYKNFSDIRYADRVEATVVGKTTDYQGKTTFTVNLPDGQTVELAENFVN